MRYFALLSVLFLATACGTQEEVTFKAPVNKVVVEVVEDADATTDADTAEEGTSVGIEASIDAAKDAAAATSVSVESTEAAGEATVTE